VLTTEEAAGQLAALLRQEHADVLLSYDPNGGYGHRDHVKVHQVGKRAAELAGVATVLEATLPRELVERLARLARTLRRAGLEACNGPPASRWLGQSSWQRPLGDQGWLFAGQDRTGPGPLRSALLARLGSPHHPGVAGACLLGREPNQATGGRA
jgi:hypothetical protein